MSEIIQIPAPEPEKCDFLIWVGGSFYKTIEEYVEEASSMGACRRISQYLTGMVQGQSRVYLAHQQHAVIMDQIFPAAKALQASWLKEASAIASKLRDGKMRTDQIPKKFAPEVIDQAMAYVEAKSKRRVVFAFYVIEDIEFLFDKRIPDKIEELIERGIVKPVPKEAWSGERKRKCGYRKVGTYVTAYKALKDSDLLEMGVDAAKVEVRGPLVVFREPFEAELIMPGRKPNRGVTRLTQEEGELLAFEAAMIGPREVSNG